MSDIKKAPGDSVDLSLLLQSYGDTLGTLYPVAHVYDVDNSEVTGSPFTLTQVANNLYAKKNAFQANHTGTYNVVYIVYTDASHATRSTVHGEQSSTINVSLMASSGLGAGSGMYFDDEYLRQLIKKMHDELKKDISAVKKEVGKIKEVVSLEKSNSQDEIIKRISDAENSIILSGVEKQNKIFSEISKIDNTGKQDEILRMILSLSQTSKGRFIDVISAIKKNRSTIIKSKFDKRLMTPILQECVRIEERVAGEFEGFKKDVSSTIDMKNGEMNKAVAGMVELAIKSTFDAMNMVNDSLRKKLKYTLENLKMFVLKGRSPKQDIKIVLKRDD